MGNRSRRRADLHGHAEPLADAEQFAAGCGGQPVAMAAAAFKARALSADVPGEVAAGALDAAGLEPLRRRVRIPDASPAGALGGTVAAGSAAAAAPAAAGRTRAADPAQRLGRPGTGRRGFGAAIVFLGECHRGIRRNAGPAAVRHGDLVPLGTPMRSETPLAGSGSAGLRPRPGKQLGDGGFRAARRSGADLEQAAEVLQCAVPAAHRVVCVEENDPRPVLGWPLLPADDAVRAGRAVAAAAAAAAPGVLA